MEPDILKDRKILLGVTGSIAAYKAILLLRALSAAGARVTVVMTGSARKFVTPLTFEALSGRKVLTDLFSGEAALQHLSLAEESDLILLAPATSNVIGKMANGVADDLLTTVLSATRSPIVVCPAMDGYMWEHPVLRRNVSTLEGLGCTIVPPEEGPLASGKSGVGRLASEAAVLAAVRRRLSVARDLAEEVILVTAGPTREPIDPVRFISNRSSGKMGYALARSALDRGARVRLVTGPTALPVPAQAEIYRVETSQEMRDCILRLVPDSTVVVMAAAVSDYRPRRVHSEKIKKSAASMTLDLETTPDILKELSDLPPLHGRRRLLVGFAAETGRVLEHARSKLEGKGLDLIVANDVTLEGAGFDSNTNIVTILGRTGEAEALPKLSKQAVADRVLDRVVRLRHEDRGPFRKKTGARSQARNGG